MTPSDSAAAMERFFQDRGLSVENSTLPDMVDAALEFFDSVFVADLVAVDEADMLLFQFGVYDWGEGENFEFDITRQFIVAGEEDDDAISQLHCTFFYEPMRALRTVGSGNRWCNSRNDLPTFRSFILSSPAFVTARLMPPKRRQIVWERI